MAYFPLGVLFAGILGKDKKKEIKEIIPINDDIEEDEKPLVISPLMSRRVISNSQNHNSPPLKIPQKLQVLTTTTPKEDCSSRGCKRCRRLQTPDDEVDEKSNHKLPVILPSKQQDTDDDEDDQEEEIDPPPVSPRRKMPRVESPIFTPIPVVPSLQHTQPIQNIQPTQPFQALFNIPHLPIPHWSLPEPIQPLQLPSAAINEDEELARLLNEQEELNRKGQWKCLHCTLHNEGSTRICGVCNKTRL